jgi:hypothetical protein
MAAANAWITDSQLLATAVSSVLLKAGIDLASSSFGDYEVLQYKRGSFFATHADRSRGDKHVGTLVAVVATADASGGWLCVDDGVRVGGDMPYLAFIPLGRTHSVTTVTAGTRYVAKAAVYGTTTADTEANEEYYAHNLPSD